MKKLFGFKSKPSTPTPAPIPTPVANPHAPKPRFDYGGRMRRPYFPVEIRPSQQQILTKDVLVITYGTTNTSLGTELTNVLKSRIGINALVCSSTDITELAQAPAALICIINQDEVSVQRNSVKKFLSYASTYYPNAKPCVIIAPTSPSAPTLSQGEISGMLYSTKGASSNLSVVVTNNVEFKSDVAHLPEWV